MRSSTASRNSIRRVNRIIEDIQLVEVFGEDNNGALRRYVQLHRIHPEKEYYVVHTSRPELNVKERNWTGIRGKMKLYYDYGLPFAEIELFNGDEIIKLSKVLIDTGSAAKILKMLIAYIFYKLSPKIISSKSIGVVSRNYPKFRHSQFSSATSASMSIILPSL